MLGADRVDIRSQLQASSQLTGGVQPANQLTAAQAQTVVVSLFVLEENGIVVQV